MTRGHCRHVIAFIRPTSSTYMLGSAGRLYRSPSDGEIFKDQRPLKRKRRYGLVSHLWKVSCTGQPNFPGHLRAFRRRDGEPDCFACAAQAATGSRRREDILLKRNRSFSGRKRTGCLRRRPGTGGRRTRLCQALFYILEGTSDTNTAVSHWMGRYSPIEEISCTI